MCTIITIQPMIIKMIVQVYDNYNYLLKGLKDIS